MPFGIPCEEPPVVDLLRSLDVRNTNIGNLIYNVVFPIGQAMTVREQMLGHTQKALAQKLRTPINRATKGISSIIEGVAGSIADALNANGNKLAQVQSAIATTPIYDTPAIPAADIRRTTPTPPEAQAIAMVANVINKADKDVGSLVALLHLLGVTAKQLVAYQRYGTIPEVYLCPDPDVHAPGRLVDVAEIPDPGFWETEE